MRAILLVLPSLFGCAVAADSNEAAQRPKTFAVVGGGIAGATTVLELLAQKDWDIDITLFEQADEIGHPSSASGIIAASMLFNANSQYWKAPDDIEDVDRMMNSMDIDADSAATYFFAHLNQAIEGEPRAERDNQRRFFAAAKDRLEEMVDKFPKLCFAIVGPWCCRTGSKAEEWMINNSEVGVSCDAWPVGWGHAFFDTSEWNKANKEKEADEMNFELGKPGTAIFQNASEFFRADDDELKGVLFSKDLGFTRVEDLFPKFREIFEEHGVKIQTKCEVEKIESCGEGLEVRVSKESSCHKVISDSGARFDRVIVASGANSKFVLNDLDNAIDAQLLPVKGFAVATDEPLIPENMRSLGLQQEEFSHYIRPQRNGGVRYGYGKRMGIPREELLHPKYEESWEDNSHAGIKLTNLGEYMLNLDDNKIKKLAGVRPLSCFNNFPLLKRYPSMPGLLLNTGYGWHGFVMSWKSSQLVVEYALHGREGEDFEFAIEEHHDDYRSWANWQKALVLVGLLGLVCCIACAVRGFVAVGATKTHELLSNESPNEGGANE